MYKLRFINEPRNVNKILSSTISLVQISKRAFDGAEMKLCTGRYEVSYNDIIVLRIYTNV